MRKVKSTIERHAMLTPGDRVGVAVSGGADSVALLHVLANLGAEYTLELVALHLNHGIRGDESDRDEAFVRELAGSMGIPLEVENISIPKLRRERGGSLEDLCREERYAFFERMMCRHRLDKIALGHTLGDQAETVIMRFLRGSGLEGLKGFLPVRDGIYIRPLMEVTRDEITSFLGEEGIPFVTDSSNKDQTYLRNRIRGRLVPELKASYNVRLEENIGRTAEILRLEDDFIRESVAGIIAEWEIDTNRTQLPVPRLKQLHPALLWRLIKTILETHSPVKNGIGYLHVKAVADLIDGQSPSACANLPFNLTARREYDDLIIAPDDRSPGESDFSYKVEIPGSVDITESGKRMVFDLVDATEVGPCSDNPVFIDYSAISFPLVVRNIRPGDRIRPLGMEGTKKVAALLMDEKVPKGRRRSILLLADRASVLWVPGVRLSDRVKMTDMTEKVVKAEII
ncbi:MAG: tRNA lysidine(34) synthetase TilS [Deltaproteobacteria bacterium]|nr:tRNA lysidine(34) synthetase TilS [Deltaproteobacteria bacterium]